MDAVCGAVFIMAWLFFVRMLITNSGWRFVLYLMGLTTPFLQIFFGHVETYVPIFLLLFVCLMLLLMHLKTQKIALLWFVVPLWIVSIRLHTLMYLLGPALLLAFAHHYLQKVSIIRKLVTMKEMLLGIFLPICLVGLYFGVFADYNDPRELKNFEDIDRLFLPIVSPNPPLDRYNLLSFHHFFDYFNAMLLWSPLLLLIFVHLGVFYRKHINWSKPEIVLLTLAALLFAVVLFMINPLFSMPMDWDLFCFPVPVLMLLSVSLIAQIQHIKLAVKLPIMCLALSLFCIPSFAVNADKKMHSYRLESVGIWVYKTYYEHSGTYIHYAQRQSKSMEEMVKRKTRVLEKLKPYAIVGKDEKYAAMLLDKGLIYLQYYQDYEKAKPYLEEAYRYYPNLKNVLIYLMEVNLKLRDREDWQKYSLLAMKKGEQLLEARDYKSALEYFEAVHSFNPAIDANLLNLLETYFRLENYREAFIVSKGLIERNYPNKQKALRIGIHCAFEAGEYGQALFYSNAYLRDFPNDPLIKKVNDRLQKNDRVDELKLLFSRPKRLNF